MTPFSSTSGCVYIGLASKGTLIHKPDLFGHEIELPADVVQLPLHRKSEGDQYIFIKFFEFFFCEFFHQDTSLRCLNYSKNAEFTRIGEDTGTVKMPIILREYAWNIEVIRFKSKKEKCTCKKS